MRPDRSLIPGLGAAASLVAAVACAFFVTAALVAFHSWPQVASTSNARALVVAADSRRARAIVVHPAARPARPATPAAPATPKAQPGQTALAANIVHTSRPRTVAAVAPVQQTSTTQTPTPQTHTTSTPTPRPNTLAGTTQVTAGNVGGLVNGLTNGLASTVAPVSQPLATTVQNLGQTASNAVIAIGDNLAQVLLGLVPSQ